MSALMEFRKLIKAKPEECDTPGRKKRSAGKGRGLAIGQGRGPIGRRREQLREQEEIHPEFDKLDVDYRQRGPDSNAPRCEICANFIPPASCMEVIGKVEKSGNCDLFEYDEVNDQLGGGVIPFSNEIR